MTNANVTNVTIRPEEEAHFSSLAREWWNAKGPMASLHEVNPVRLAFLREAIDMYWGDDVQARRPLSGRSALDVGCGAGLVCEPMARLGADVTGVDASAENIGVASAHAESSALDIRYMAGEFSRHITDVQGRAFRMRACYADVFCRGINTGYIGTQPGHRLTH